MDIGDDSNNFIDLYPDHAWVSDSVLWLGNKDRPESGHDEVLVTNNSRQAISYLHVRTCGWEMFWLFDVKPGETVKLDSCPRVAYLSSFGKFAGGKEISYAEKGFKVEGEYKIPGQYYSIEISDDGAKINSSDVEASK
jgi:hypothetical protein